MCAWVFNEVFNHDGTTLLLLPKKTFNRLPFGQLTVVEVLERTNLTRFLISSKICSAILPFKIHVILFSSLYYIMYVFHVPIKLIKYHTSYSIMAIRNTEINCSNSFIINVYISFSYPCFTQWKQARKK